MAGGWWLVAGGWMAGGWWLVAGGWGLVAGGWWLVAGWLVNGVAGWVAWLAGWVYWFRPFFSKMFDEQVDSHFQEAVQTTNVVSKEFLETGADELWSVVDWWCRASCRDPRPLPRKAIFQDIVRGVRFISGQW
jgi:hypothetical protein